MLTLPPSCRIWLATRPTDMRKGMDGLLGEVRTRWDDDPFGGHLFSFPSRDASRVKILWWHDGGLCLFAKRLEKGHSACRGCSQARPRWRWTRRT